MKEKSDLEIRKVLDNYLYKHVNINSFIYIRFT